MGRFTGNGDTSEEHLRMMLGTRPVSPLSAEVPRLRAALGVELCGYREGVTLGQPGPNGMMMSLKPWSLFTQQNGGSFHRFFFGMFTTGEKSHKKTRHFDGKIQSMNFQP